jgi:hypothetical protein
MAQPILAGLILSVSTSPLNDQEPGFTYVRWSITDLTDYLNQGLIEIGNYRPDAFMSTREIELGSGTQQALSAAPGARLLKSIDYNGPSSLCPGAPITECDLNLMRTFYKKPCLMTGGASDYRVLGYAYDAKNPQVFYVSPPVPDGNNAFVTGTFVIEPDQFTYASGSWTPTNDLTLDQQYLTLLRYFIAAKAFEVDTESTSSQAESQGLYKKFYNGLGVQYKMVSDYNKGKYIGQGGDQNMTKQRVE